MAITRFNQSAVIDWEFNTEGFQYRKLKDLPENVTFRLRGCFVTPDQGYGPGAVLITDQEFINIPQRYVQTLSDIREDPEAVAEIKAGKAGFHYTTFKSRNNGGTGYNVVFDEIK